MKYYLVAGEASGDLHASNLMKAIKEKDKEAKFRFFGGELMSSVRDSLLVIHYREMAYMGIIPVLLNFRKILRNMRVCRTEIQAYQPDAVILVDYPGFNLKIAKFVKKNFNIPVFYYISPKIWAWKKYRIKTIKKYIDRMLCILPFEADFYKSLHYEADYTGNPTVDEVNLFLKKNKNSRNAFINDNRLHDKPLIAVLPGSRKQEIRKNLPKMLSSVDKHIHYQFVIAGAPGLVAEDYNQYIENRKDIKILFHQTYSILQHAEIALVTSGTATLETALFNVPQIVCYHVSGGKLVNFVFRYFFHVKYISLVNLIAGKEAVKELFGAKFSSSSINNEIDTVINDGEYRKNMIEAYQEIAAKLGNKNSSKNAAAIIVNNLSSG
ncbi:MAG: lipid-A-disaccharide synthase [Tannerella sp.]|jgi:lipid-A-disaccharide synthase|nr:lipid-A-disaccharide synthase [Tannerella sp.]